MAIILEIQAGPSAGKRVAVMGGQTVSVGRTDRAKFLLPHDTFMSGVHFTVEDGPQGCVLTDQKSSNGTFVNEAKVSRAILKDGDQVRSGQTVFLVRFVEEGALPALVKQAPPIGSPLPKPPLPVAPMERTMPLDDAASKVRSRTDAPPPKPQPAPPVSRPIGKPVITIGGWTFATVPEQWKAQGDFGIQRDVPDGFPSSVVVTEEPLGGGLSLQQYVEAQLGMLREYLRTPQIDAAVPPHVHGSDETTAVDVRYKTKDGQAVFYRRLYVRAGRSVGVLTFTTLENDLSQLRPALDAIISGARFRPSTLSPGL